MPNVSLNGVNLYYELHGSATKPLVVLNNGLIMNAATSWVFQTQTLSNHFQVLQYDCRGQGQSEHPEGAYSMQEHADDLAALLGHLGQERANILGISYGGEVAQAFALAYPRMTQSIILADTVSQVDAELSITVQSWIDALKLSEPDFFFNVTVPWNFSQQFILANPALLEDARRRYATLDFPAVVRLCECFLEVDFTSQLNLIQSPTCIIVGDKDILKGVDYAEIIRKQIKHAEYHVIRDCGHASCWEKPAEFNSIVIGFISKVTQFS